MSAPAFRFSYNVFAYQWSFPEVVAHGLSLFRDADLDIDFGSFRAGQGANKNAVYEDLIRSGRSDLYHAGEWACISRVVEAPESCLVARSVPGEGTLNSSFSTFVSPGSSIEEPGDLAKRKVAIELGTGSYYTAILDMSPHVPMEDMRLVQIGSPHRRLLSLMEGEVDAASLIHPWTELATAMGMTRVMETGRKNPTLAVTRRSMPPAALERFFRAVNSAIEVINGGAGLARSLYVAHFEEILATMPEPVRLAAKGIRDWMAIPKWNRWEAYGREEFDGTCRWMKDRGLLPKEAAYEDAAYPDMEGIFA
ncbi:MAG: hypothetical protein JRN39_06410 [Nitrososphaerota archaeon]|nr:hypothetical protein [Nitrososphaerota archaeon]MDG6940016.1 hypothetical protein [Nitrososphaerota archaeon]